MMKDSRKRKNLKDDVKSEYFIVGENFHVVLRVPSNILPTGPVAQGKGLSHLQDVKLLRLFSAGESQATPTVQGAPIVIFSNAWGVQGLYLVVRWSSYGARVGSDVGNMQGMCLKTPYYLSSPQ